MARNSRTLREVRPTHDVLRRHGNRKPLDTLGVPEWHGWQYQSEAARIIRWCEEILTVPVGIGMGQQFRIPPFQRDILRRVCESLATFISIAAGNGKTTFMSAVGLERISRGDDYVEVDIIATKEDQAERLIMSAIKLVEMTPALHEVIDYRARDGVLIYRPTGSLMRAHPARLSAVQGLNFSLCLIDEIGFVHPDIVSAMLARLGKRADARVIGFGTPGIGQDNMLETLRAQAQDGTLPPLVEFIEYMAPPGCELTDREAWRVANPALEAGFLREEALAVQAATMEEHEFRMYHLGQPIAASGPWLPHAAWENCRHADPPVDGDAVVLGVWGNYRRMVSIVGCTLDGGVFFGWQGEQPTDDEVALVLRQACEQWQVEAVVHKPHIRTRLMQQLGDEGLPVEAWPATRELDVESTAALYQAITFGEVAHDHNGELDVQVRSLRAQIDRKGNPRLVESEDEVVAALAMRVAWWKARVLAEEGVGEELVIY